MAIFSPAFLPTHITGQPRTSRGVDENIGPLPLELQIQGAVYLADLLDNVTLPRLRDLGNTIPMGAALGPRPKKIPSLQFSRTMEVFVITVIRLGNYKLSRR